MIVNHPNCNGEQHGPAATSNNWLGLNGAPRFPLSFDLNNFQQNIIQELQESTEVDIGLGKILNWSCSNNLTTSCDKNRMRSSQWLTRLFSFQASGNFGLCFSLDTSTCMSSKEGWFPASAWKAIWYSGTASPSKQKEKSVSQETSTCLHSLVLLKNTLMRCGTLITH